MYNRNLFYMWNVFYLSTLIKVHILLAYVWLSPKKIRWIYRLFLQMICFGYLCLIGIYVTDRIKQNIPADKKGVLTDTDSFGKKWIKSVRDTASARGLKFDSAF